MRYLVLMLVLVVTAAPASAHHPGDRLDEVMAAKEPAFEQTDLRSMPDLVLTDAQGASLSLADLQDQIVILSFVTRDCGKPCAEQQHVLAAVQEQVNITPMKPLVTFLTISDASLTIEAAWDDANWRLAVPSGESAVDSADRFAELSERRSPARIVHVVDRGGRHAGLFHGTDFSQTNLLHYINGLTNAPYNREQAGGDGWWDRIRGLFE